MAHAALVYLIHLVDKELIQFAYSVLEIEGEKARLFLLEAKNVLNELSKFRSSGDVPYSYVMALRKGLEPLALTINEVKGEFPEMNHYSRQILGNYFEFERKIGNFEFELDGMILSLENFLQKLDEQVGSHSGPTLTQQQELGKDLLVGCKEFSETIEYFDELLVKAVSINYRAGSLLEELQGYDEAELNQIKRAAERTGDSIEELLNMAEFGKTDVIKDNTKIHYLLEDIDQLLANSWPFRVSSRLSRRLLRARKRKAAFRPFPDAEEAEIWPDIGDDIRDMIDKLIRSSSQLTILSILDTDTEPAIGKTTVAEQVYSHPILRRLFNFRAKVNTPSSIDSFLSHLLHSFAPNLEEIHGQCSEDKGQLLHNTLKGKKFLVVVDGLQNLEIWDSVQIYFPDDKVGSRVLLTTHWNLANTRTESSGNSSLERQHIAVGFEEETSLIIEELTRPPTRLSIVTIVGMGGIGKTTLAKKVFQHPDIQAHFHCLAWVNNVSRMDQVLSDLLHDIEALSEDAIQEESSNDKGERLYRRLKGRRYLIVVDGLWNFEAWDAAQRYLPDDINGSRILITTRVTQFLTTPSIKKNPPHFMTPLDRHQSWELLEKLVFPHESCPTELVDVGKRIAAKCGGLPLAIVVIAGILRSIPGSMNSWCSIMFGVTSILSTDAEPCLNTIALSYNYLPHEYKACFLYLGAFPSNFPIEVPKLLNLWIANDFFLSNHPESEAEKCLEDLTNRSLVWVAKRSFDGKVKRVVIHDLVRQLCLKEAQKENFMHVLEANAKVDCSEKPRHLIFNSESLDDFQLLPPIPHLHSFIWLNLGSGFTPGMILLQLSAFKWLRVLDIYLLPFDSFPVQLLNLVKLRYLALNVTYELDASLSQFSLLETLLVYGPWVSSGNGDGNPILLLEFWKMPWLRNVIVKVPSCLKYPNPLQPLLDSPQGPSNLQILSTITFSSCTEELLHLMPYLKKLAVSETKEDFENGELNKCFHNLSFLTGLETLKCSFYKGNGEAGSLDWGILPANLKKLSLNGSRLSWDQMKFLALLPRLETLKLKNYAFQGPEWVVTAEVFDSLKQLLIDTTDLVKWEVESTDQFPRLERLVLKSCKFLEKIPLDIILDVIELHHCSESAKNSALKFEKEYGNPNVVTVGYK